MNTKQIFAILVFTLLEVWRSRLWFFALLLIALVCGAAVFASSLAITESVDYRLVTYASLIRLAGVLVIILFVATSVVRDFDDGVVDLILARSTTRTDWYIGKVAAYTVVAMVFATAASLPLAFLGAYAVVPWGVSYAAELVIVVAISLAFAVTLRNVTITVTCILGFYLLARTINTLVLMSGGATVDIARPINQFIAAAIAGIAHLLPQLSQFTQSVWLVQQAETHGFNVIFLQTLIYVCLLSAIGMFDLHRRNL